MGHSVHPLGYPSVTTILGVRAMPWLYRWYASKGWDECERIKRDAGEFGSRVHDLIEAALKVGPAETVQVADPNGREVQMMVIFNRWVKQSGYQAVELERKVESAKYEYSGTLDSIGHFGDSNNLFILDWKTSSKIDDFYGCQLAAYAHAYKEETGREIQAGGIVRLEKDPAKFPQIEVRTFNDLPKYFKVFKACLELYNFQHKKRQKKAA